MAAEGHSTGSTSSAGQGSWIDRLRLLLLLPAVPVAVIAYRHHLQPGPLPWWQWLVEMAVAAALTVIAIGGSAPLPSESALRRWLRRACLPLALISLAVAIRSAGTLGAELSTAVWLVLALLLFLLSRAHPFTAESLACVLDADFNPRSPIALEDPRCSVRSPSALGPPGSEIPLDSAAEARSESARYSSSGSRPARRSLVAMFAALVLVAAAMFVNDSQRLAALWLWLFGLATLMVAAWHGDRMALSPPGGCARRAHATVCPQKWFDPPAGWQWFLLLLVMLVAVLYRFPGIAAVPVLIDADEGRHGASAVRMWREGTPDFFAFGWNSFPNLAYLAEYALIPVVGQSYVALRLSAAVFGTASVLFTFFWVRRWWGAIASLLAALMVAINQEHLYWSRVGFNNIHSALVAVVLMWSFARVLQRGRWRDYVMLGYAAGAGFYTYHAAKLFPALLLVPCLVLVIGLPALVRRHLAGGLVAVYALVLLVAPQGTWIYRNWEMFQRDTMNRFDVHLMVEAHERGNFEEVRRHLYTHVADSLFVFLSVPHKLSLFEIWVGVPLLLGFAWMLWHWRDPRHLAVLAWIAGQLVIGSMLTAFPPNKPRLVGMIPIACVVPAVLIAEIWRRIRLAWGDVGGAAATVAVVVWLGGAAYSNWYTQFVHMAWLQSADAQSFLLRKITEVPRPAIVYTIGAEATLGPRHALRDAVMEQPRDLTLVNLASDADAVPLPPHPSGNALIFVTRHQAELAPLIRYYYPQALEEVVRSTDGADLLYCFTINSADLVRVRSLQGSFRDASGRQWSETLPIEHDMAVLGGPSQAVYPVEVRWVGQVWLVNPGRYSFEVDRGQLSVGWPGWLDQAAPAATRAEDQWAAGWQPIRIAATLTSPQEKVAITWGKAPEHNMQPLPRQHLNSHALPVALLGRYYEPGFEVPSDRLIREQLHSAVSFQWQLIDDDDPPLWFLPTGSRAEWRGRVEVDLPHQPLQLIASIPTEVLIDGEVVLASDGKEGPPRIAVLEGAPGWREIEVRAVRPTHASSQHWQLRLLWGTPGGGWTGKARYSPSMPPAVQTE